jgi:hypothetical protein
LISSAPTSAPCCTSAFTASAWHTLEPLVQRHVPTLRLGVHVHSQPHQSIHCLRVTLSSSEVHRRDVITPLSSTSAFTTSTSPQRAARCNAVSFHLSRAMRSKPIGVQGSLHVGEAEEEQLSPAAHPTGLQASAFFEATKATKRNHIRGAGSLLPHRLHASAAIVQTVPARKKDGWAFPSMSDPSPPSSPREKPKPSPTSPLQCPCCVGLGQHRVRHVRSPT